MTLGQFFDTCSTNSELLIFYFTALPITAALALYFGKDQGNVSPWTYLYSFLVYAACIPGIFSVTLSIYKFFFERGSIMDANVFTQILPIFSMFITLALIRRNVKLDDVPGFGKLSSLMFMIALVLIAMWIMEKTNLFIFTYMPFYQFIILLVGIFLLIRFLFKRAL